MSSGIGSDSDSDDNNDNDNNIQEGEPLPPPHVPQPKKRKEIARRVTRSAYEVRQVPADLAQQHRNAPGVYIGLPSSPPADSPGSEHSAPAAITTEIISQPRNKKRFDRPDSALSTTISSVYTDPSDTAPEAPDSRLQEIPLALPQDMPSTSQQTQFLILQEQVKPRHFSATDDESMSSENLISIPTTAAEGTFGSIPDITTSELPSNILEDYESVYSANIQTADLTSEHGSSSGVMEISEYSSSSSDRKRKPPEVIVYPATPKPKMSLIPSDSEDSSLQGTDHLPIHVMLEKSKQGIQEVMEGVLAIGQPSSSKRGSKIDYKIEKSTEQTGSSSKQLERTGEQEMITDQPSPPKRLRQNASPKKRQSSPESDTSLQECLNLCGVKISTHTKTTEASSSTYSEERLSHKASPERRRSSPATPTPIRNVSRLETMPIIEPTRDLERQTDTTEAVPSTSRPETEIEERSPRKKSPLGKLKDILYDSFHKKKK